jgi:putative NIF3 family GTP cyclohydrolase 1 type 2
MITLKQFYNYALEQATKNGPRPKLEIEAKLKELKKQYEKMEEKDKQYFDHESLINPFLDSRIEVGDPTTKLKRVLVGIDITVGEMLLASELGRNGKKVDAVIAHHPEGRALIDLTQVMDIQDDIAVLEGVPINVAEKLMQGRVADIQRGLHSSNHFQVPDAAKLLNIPFACFHTMADNMVYSFIKKYIDKKKPKKVADIVAALLELPEYQQAKKLGNGPKMFVGDERATCGKISYSGFTGGTSGPKDIYEQMAHAGVGTILAMHIPEEHRKLAEKYHINVLICGHMASDSLGMNLLLDKLEKEKVEILPCSGFIRVSRK